MALTGGGGAGNVAGGANPSGIGTNLNYVGDFAYAYSGPIGVADTETTLLQFDTGPLILEMEARFTYGAANSDDYVYKIYMNDQVALQDISGGTTQAHWFPQYKLIIPPYTRIKLTAANVTDSSNVYQGAVISGRVYA